MGDQGGHKHVRLFSHDMAETKSPTPAKLSICGFPAKSESGASFDDSLRQGESSFYWPFS